MPQFLQRDDARLVVAKEKRYKRATKVGFLLPTYFVVAIVAGCRKLFCGCYDWSRVQCASQSAGRHGIGKFLEEKVLLRASCCGFLNMGNLREEGAMKFSA